MTLVAEFAPQKIPVETAVIRKRKRGITEACSWHQQGIVPPFVWSGHSCPLLLTLLLFLV
jgi:hypothetical protein